MLNGNHGRAGSVQSVILNEKRLLFQKQVFAVIFALSAIRQSIRCVGSGVLVCICFLTIVFKFGLREKRVCEICRGFYSFHAAPCLWFT